MKKVFEHILRFIKRDFLRKLIAVAVALLIYHAIERDEETQSVQFEVPVEIITPEGMVCVGGNSNVELSFTCKSRDRELFSKLRGQLHIDPAKYTPGAPYRVTLTESVFNFPRSVSDFRASPAHLALNIENIAKKKVPVAARYDANKLSRDYAVGSIRFEPESVELTGPATVLNEISTIYCTEPIPLDRTLTMGFDQAMRLKIPSGVKSNVSEVLASVEIIPSNTVRRIRNLPLSLVYSGTEKRFFRPQGALPAVEVTVEGMVDKVNSLPPEALRPYLDLSGAGGGGRQTLPVKCIVPAGENGFFIRSVTPEKVTLDLIE